MAPRVLISDKLSPTAVQIFRDRGVEVDYQPDLGKDKDKLFAIIGDYEGLAIRSATKVTEKILSAAKNLKVIGRAGIGVDNVDVPAATAKGVIVMNTPFGNSITTAEHAIAMMFALARQIPEANASTHAGKWEKNRFMGVELTSKTLGIIGCGNIGSIVAERAIGLRMHVIAFDPFLSAERAVDLGVEKVELDELFRRSDFITLHTPLTDKTRNIIDISAILKMKKGVRIINCARGGLIVEADLKAALDSGHVAGAALDVFEVEPATEHPLFGHPNVVCTPHLGASTTEAQENVALQVAEQMADYLMKGAVQNALNMPSITAEEAPKLTPFVKLAEQLGSFAGQLTEEGIKEIRIEYEGEVAGMNTRALTAAAITGVLRPLLQTVNMVSAPIMARERGVQVSEVRRDAAANYDSLVRLVVVTDQGRERAVAGTVFADGRPRIVEIKGIKMEAEFSPSMIYVTNEDKPGFIGRFAGLLGDAGINIATFSLGRHAPGADAICLVEVDGTVPPRCSPRSRRSPPCGRRRRWRSETRGLHAASRHDDREWPGFTTGPFSCRSPAAPLIGFFEAILFFVAPDIAIARIALDGRVLRAVLACLATIASATVGGLVTYTWFRLDPDGAMGVLLKVPAVGPGTVASAAKAVTEEGWFHAALAGALSGVPYKIYAALAPAAGLSPFDLAAMTPVVRLPRFAAVALAFLAIGRLFGGHRDALPRWADKAFYGGWAVFYAIYWSLSDW